VHIANILQIECICCCSEWIEPWNNYSDELEHPEVYDTALSKINMFNMCQDFLRQVGVNLTWMVCTLAGLTVANRKIPIAITTPDSNITSKDYLRIFT
jgi:hypothetical protein